MVRMKTQVKLILFSLTMVFLCIACVKGPEGNGGKRVKGTGPVRIGFSMDTLKEERWQRDKALVEQRCQQVGAQCEVQVANGDDAVQTKQCDNLLTKGVDVLIVAPHNGQIKIVTKQYAREWLASEALRIMEDALTKNNNDIQAVVASNDGTAGGAISALPPQLVGKVLVTGQDAALDAVQRVVEGKQTMTIYKPIQPLAFAAVDSAVKLARGEKVDAKDKINNGKIDVPSLLFEPMILDKDNVMQTVIKDGYHKLEDVYKNVPKEQWPKQ